MFSSLYLLLFCKCEIAYAIASVFIRLIDIEFIHGIDCLLERTCDQRGLD